MQFEIRNIFLFQNDEMSIFYIILILDVRLVILYEFVYELDLDVSTKLNCHTK